MIPWGFVFQTNDFSTTPYYVWGACAAFALDIVSQFFTGHPRPRVSGLRQGGGGSTRGTFTFLGPHARKSNVPTNGRARLSSLAPAAVFQKKGVPVIVCISFGSGVALEVL